MSFFKPWESPPSVCDCAYVHVYVKGVKCNASDIDEILDGVLSGT